MKRSKTLKRIIALLFLGGIATVVGILIYRTVQAQMPVPAWTTLKPEDKISEFKKWLQGGSLYLRAGSTGFAVYLNEMYKLYQSSGLPWPESEVQNALMKYGSKTEGTGSGGYYDNLLARDSHTETLGTDHLPTSNTDRPGIDQ